MPISVEVNPFLNANYVQIDRTLYNNPFSYVNTESLVSTPKIKNQKKYYKRNKFMISSLYAIGGGALNVLYNGCEYGRVGGSTQDKVNYLNTYVNHVPEGCRVNKSAAEYAKLCFLGTKVKVLSADLAASMITINKDASPGYFYQKMGFKTKEEAFEHIFSMAINCWDEGMAGGAAPYDAVEVWQTASRPKLTKLEKAGLKARNGKPVGRVISMCGSMEQFISYPIWKPLMDNLLALNHHMVHWIALGMQKHSPAWRGLGSRLERATTIYCGDWSGFDAGVPPDMVRFAIDIIEASLDMSDAETVNYWAYIRPFLVKNLIKKEYRIGDELLIHVENGVPSGSLWTSLIDSIINFVVCSEIMEHMGITTYEPFTYGDDHIIIIYGNEEKRKHLKRRFAKIAWERFGFKSSPSDSYVTTGGECRVGYKRPVYHPGNYLELGTRNLTPIRWQYSDIPFDGYNHMFGTTHRWYYDFRRRPKFLSFYWDKDLNPIRSVGENLTRLINPEQPVKTPIDHEVLLVSHALDNFYNDHNLNWAYHLLYDCQFMKASFDYNQNDFPHKLNNLRNKVYRAQLSLPCKPGRRAWYRRVEGYVDLKASPTMQVWNAHFRAILMQGIGLLASANTEPEIYQQKGSLTSAIVRLLHPNIEVELSKRARARHTEPGYTGIMSDVSFDVLFKGRKQTTYMNHVLHRLVGMGGYLGFRALMRRRDWPSLILAYAYRPTHETADIHAVGLMPP